MKNKVYFTLSVVFIALSVIISLLGGSQSINSGVLIPFALFLSSILIFITNLVPFSVMETGTIVLIIFVLFNIIYKLIKKTFQPKAFFIKCLLFASIAIFIFTINYGIYYNSESFYKLNKDVTTQQIYSGALKLTEMCNKYVDTKEKSFNETAKDVISAYKSAKEKPFTNIIPRPKSSLFSKLMSYSYISGIHVPFTGETLINNEMPAYTIPFSMAHETAHSMSIAREEEANFAAFYVLINYGSDNLRFSAAAECLRYFLDELYENDQTLYIEIINKLDIRVIEKYKELNEFLNKHDTAAKDIAEKINDTYLKSQGQQSGTASYGEVVILLANYLEHF